MSTDTSDRLMLLDAASLYYRAFFGVPATVTAPDGTPVNAVRGFLDMITRLVDDHAPTHLVACWDDDWRPAWRVAAMPSYKTHRVAGAVVPGAGGAPQGNPPEATGAGAVVPEETPDALEPQVPVIVEVLAALGIARVGALGCEADDVIGTLATRAPVGTAVDIVTGDRDLFQLVDDDRRVRVLYTGRGVRNLELLDQAALQAKYAVGTGDLYADLAVLRGDPSDGIPGVSGIGEKTAATLLARYGDLGGLRDAVDTGDRSLKPGVRAALEAARDYLDSAPAVVRVLRDADLPGADDRVPPVPADPAALDALAQRWGLASSLERLLPVLAARA